MAEANTILVLTAGGPYPWVLINTLVDRFGNVRVVMEDSEPKGSFLKRRARKVGWASTAGQFMTMMASRFGKRLARAREAEIIAAQKLSTEPDARIPLTRVSSANAPESIAAIRAANPAVVVLAGCRMLSAATLADIPCPVINYHAGINPKYRGMQGGYWARALGDIGNYGTTVHLVDAGVDTGGILYRAHLTPDPRETMLTDAMAQVAGSRAILIRAVEDALSDRISPMQADLPSAQRFHPPIWTYVRIGLTKGVW